MDHKSEEELQQELQAELKRGLSVLSPLVGTWVGRGRGQFPTIDAFEYREVFCVWRDEGSPHLVFRQRTELLDAAGQLVEEAHVEVGIIRPLDGERWELSNAQSGGRVEVLRGKRVEAEGPHDLLALQWSSVLLGNDERMRASERNWTCGAESLRYSMRMATGDVSATTLHLEADLTRTTDDPGQRGF